jgi:hypothetical protein
VTDWLTWDDGALTADIVTQVSASADAEITNHPIEAGSEISDHVIKRPRRVTFEFAQSSIPLAQEDETDWEQVPWSVRESQFKPTGLLALSMLAGQAIAAIGSLVGLGGAPTQIWVLTATKDEDRIKKLHDKLIELWQNSTEVTFNYQGLYLPGYVLAGVQYTRGVPGGIVRFTVEAQAVQTVETGISSLTGSLANLAQSAINLVPLLRKGSAPVEKIEAEVVRRQLGESGLNSLGGFGDL